MAIQQLRIYEIARIKNLLKTLSLKPIFLLSMALKITIEKHKKENYRNNVISSRNVFWSWGI